MVATSASQKTSRSKIEETLFAGAYAGVLSRVVSAPLDLLKIRFQLQTGARADVKYKSLWQAATTIVKEEGLTSLWKGNVSATYLWVTYSMVQFGTYGVLEEWSKEWELKLAATFSNDGGGPFVSEGGQSNLSKDKIHANRFLHTLVLFLCGAGAAFVSTSATYPFDLMRTQFSLQGTTKLYSSVPAFITSTFKKQGLTGFYAGLGPSLVGVAPYIGLNFALYDLAKGWIQTDGGGKIQSQRPWLDMIKKSAAGGFAGTASKLIVYPLDTVKRRMQAGVLRSTLEVAEGAPAMRRYRNMVDCVATILKDEGFQGLYRGIGPTLLKSCVSTAVTFAAYEHGLQLARSMRWIKCAESVILKQ